MAKVFKFPRQPNGKKRKSTVRFPMESLRVRGKLRGCSSSSASKFHTTKTLFLFYLLGCGSDKPDEPDRPVQVRTPLAAPRHRWRDLLRASTALCATRFASPSTKAKSGLLDSIMTSCFRALCTPKKVNKRSFRNLLF